MPHPSRGCTACRAKKVKCSGGIPSCQRCLKAGRTCSGYRSKSEFIFRDMTSISEVRVQARFISRTQARGSHITPPPPKTGSTSQGCNTINTISPPVSTKWEDIAIPRFLADYADSSDIAEGNLQFIKDFANKSHFAFMETLKAVSNLSLGSQLKLEWLKVKASRHLCHALPLAAHLLDSPADSRDDLTLATIYLFGLYSMISGEDVPHSPFRDPYHHNGRTSLLAIRGKDQFQNSTGRNLFYMNYTHLTMKCLIKHQQPPPEADEWIRLITNISKSHHLLPKHNLQTARLCANAQGLFDATLKDETWIQSLLQFIKEGILLDSTYQRWSASLSGFWAPKYLRTPHREIGALHQRHVYHHLYAAFRWNNYRACRIHLLEVLLHCMDLAREDPCAHAILLDVEEMQEVSKSTIRELVSDICSSMDFCLGVVDANGNQELKRPLGGYLSCWPLYIAMISAGESKTRGWLAEKLVEIADGMGIEIARRLVGRQREFPWDLR